MMRIEFTIKWLLEFVGIHFCEEPRCWSRDTLRCTIHLIKNGEDEVNYYCTEHASKHGYCWACGEFWAGCESFDFNQMQLCPNCYDEYRDDLEEMFDGPYDPYLDALPDDELA